MAFTSDLKLLYEPTTSSSVLLTMEINWFLMLFFKDFLPKTEEIVGNEEEVTEFERSRKMLAQSPPKEVAKTEVTNGTPGYA